MRVGRQRRRTALLAVVSAAAHLLLLTLVIRGVPPPRMPVLDDSQRAIRVTLEPRRRPAQPQTPAHVRPPSPPLPRPAHLLPSDRPPPPFAPPAVSVAPPQAAPPSPAPVAAGAGTAQSDQAWARLGRAILGHTGCADPDAAGLNAAERAACQDRVAQSLARAKPLPLGISPRKQAAFDRVVDCQEKYERGTVPAGTAESNGTSITGLGYIPKAHECPPGAR